VRVANMYILSRVYYYLYYHMFSRCLTFCDVLLLVSEKMHKTCGMKAQYIGEVQVVSGGCAELERT
jgi:hypothetical protein